MAKQERNSPKTRWQYIVCTEGVLNHEKATPYRMADKWDWCRDLPEAEALAAKYVEDTGHRVFLFTVAKIVEPPKPLVTEVVDEHGMN